MTVARRLLALLGIGFGAAGLGDRALARGILGRGRPGARPIASVVLVRAPIERVWAAISDAAIVWATIDVAVIVAVLILPPSMFVTPAPLPVKLPLVAVIAPVIVACVAVSPPLRLTRNGADARLAYCCPA